MYVFIWKKKKIHEITRELFFLFLYNFFYIRHSFSFIHKNKKIKLIPFKRKTIVPLSLKSCLNFPKLFWSSHSSTSASIKTSLQTQIITFPNEIVNMKLKSTATSIFAQWNNIIWTFTCLINFNENVTFPFMK